MNQTNLLAHLLIGGYLNDLNWLCEEQKSITTTKLAKELEKNTRAF